MTFLPNSDRFNLVTIQKSIDERLDDGSLDYDYFTTAQLLLNALRDNQPLFRIDIDTFDTITKKLHKFSINGVPQIHMLTNGVLKINNPYLLKDFASQIINFY